MQATILRKLTIKTCGDFTVAKIKRALQTAAGFTGEKPNDIPDGLTVDLLKVAGESTGAVTAQTDKGEYTKLSGSFIGTDMTTGELYQSGVCILPQFVGAQLGAALLSNKGSAVEFAFLIQAKSKASSVTGYEFVVKPLMESKPTDSMARLMSLAGIDSAPKLSAPEGKPEGDGKAVKSKK